jgi:hypothetical protein
LGGGVRESRRARRQRQPYPQPTYHNKRKNPGAHRLSLQPGKISYILPCKGKLSISLKIEPFALTLG